MDENKLRDKVIAIDGPAGAGKSSVAREVAKGLGYIYIDTGAMYRALTLKAINQSIDLSDEEALTEMAEGTDIALAYAENKSQIIYLDGHDVSTDIRSPEVSQNVSLVAKVPGVRKEMVILQRQLASRGGVIMDGRDIGTNVLPKADLKFYLTASVDIRAKRRFIEMKNQGYDVDLASLKEEIAQRDKMDWERKTAPLVKAPDAICIDTSAMNLNEVIAKIADYLR